MTSHIENFTSEDRSLLRDAVSRFVARHSAFPQRRTVGKPQEGQSLWSEIAELGLTGLLVNAQDGGTGGGDEELALVMEFFGHGLVVEPFLGTAVLGASLVDLLANKTQRDGWLPALVAGDLRIALAHFEATSGFARNPVMTRAETRTGGVVLRGAKSYVLDAPVAGMLLVSACELDGYSLFAVPVDATGVVLKPWTTVDGRAAADLMLNEVHVAESNRLGLPGQAGDALAWALDRATLAICSDALGSMQNLLAQTRDYLQTRRQFGQPLARFQVLQHRLVDMHIAIEESRALLGAARATLVHDSQQRTAAVAAAKYKVGQSARLVGEQSVQLHGAMGMTQDLPVSHHFKRLLTADAMFGDCDFQLERFRAAGGSVPG
jgi:alkylation response protein AidB-like acyl-CoA dehydrogenase